MQTSIDLYEEYLLDSSNHSMTKSLVQFNDIINNIIYTNPLLIVCLQVSHNSR